MFDKYIVPCKKCGELFNSFDHDSYDGDTDCTDPYQICMSCNDEFWVKWYQLPKCKLIDSVWYYTYAHFLLIKEYHKENYFT